MLKKIFALLWVAAFLAGCASLPDGARVPQLDVQSLQLTSQDNNLGFNLQFSLEHGSVTALELQELKVNISVNGELVSSYSENVRNVSIAPNQVMSLQRFIPLDRQNTLASVSLNNRLVKVAAVCEVQAIFDTRNESSNYNPSQTYTQVVGYGN